MVENEDNRVGSEPLTDKPATEERPSLVVQSDARTVPEIAPAAEQQEAVPAPSDGANIETQQVQTTKIECSRGLADWLVMNNAVLAPGDCGPPFARLRPSAAAGGEDAAA